MEDKNFEIIQSEENKEKHDKEWINLCYLWITIKTHNVFNYCSSQKRGVRWEQKVYLKNDGRENLEKDLDIQVNLIDHQIKNQHKEILSKKHYNKNVKDQKQKES